MNVATLRAIITCAGLAIITAARAIAPENNVIITKLEAAYTIEADCSSAAICVRAEEKRTYTATRANASDIWATFYDESISIDRAKAPGATPIYRAWEDDDLFPSKTANTPSAPTVRTMFWPNATAIVKAVHA